MMLAHHSRGVLMMEVILNLTHTHTRTVHRHTCMETIISATAASKLLYTPLGLGLCNHPNVQLQRHLPCLYSFIGVCDQC